VWGQKTPEQESKYDALVVRNEERNIQIAKFVCQVVSGEIEIEQIEHGGPGIVFVRKIEHAKILAEIVSMHLGVSVPHVTSEMPKEDREALVARMKARDPQVPVAVACMVWSTGIDIPAIEWVMWAGEGQAPIFLKQGGGRATRQDEDKEGFVILDVQSFGPGTEGYQEQAKRRLNHYRAGGFTVIDESGRGVGTSAQSSDEPDVRKTAQLYAILSGEKSAAPPKACDIDSVSNTGDDTNRADEPGPVWDVITWIVIIIFAGLFLSALMRS